MTECDVAKLGANAEALPQGRHGETPNSTWPFAGSPVVQEIVAEFGVVAARSEEITGGVVSPPLLTFTVSGALVPMFPAVSYAFTRSWYEPFPVCVVSHDQAYGDEPSVNMRTPSRQNSTLVTPTLSVADAMTGMVPLTVPLVG